jgi:3-oxoacyl-[acyl-carrier-protein] synthase-1
MGGMDIRATGLCCAVGLDAASACAAMRARIAGFRELPYADARGEPIVGAAVPGFDPKLRRRERLVELLRPALAETLKAADLSAEQTHRIPLLLGLAEPGRPGGGEPWARSILAAVEEQLGLRFDPVRSAVIARGHTAGFEALRIARELLQSRAVPACLVAGVDSLVNAATLLWLDRHQRLKTPENADGVIPGEAAACVLLTRSATTADAATATRTEPAVREGVAARIIGLGFGREEALLLNDEPMRGLGLAEAARAALAEAGLALHEIDFRLADATGESYGFREQALLQARLLRQRRESQPIWHAADSIGDTGAAAGIVHLIRAEQAFQGRYAPGARAIATASALDGSRAVALIAAAQPASAPSPSTGTASATASASGRAAEPARPANETRFSTGPRPRRA